ncbi:hypothetical protein [Algibacillus agarilyticus]|uniref:hypothetical protein n=1 Tax=Algibacillus agarilyticus TaxID=2234133 RepID=UPI001300A40A|nr:hypothetical protein [Algibacillus agarilyticus]
MGGICQGCCTAAYQGANDACPTRLQRVKSTASVLTSADEKHLKTFKKEHALFKQSKKK